MAEQVESDDLRERLENLEVLILAILWVSNAFLNDPFQLRPERRNARGGGSCKIMANHTKSWPWKCLLRMRESGFQSPRLVPLWKGLIWLDGAWECLIGLCPPTPKPRSIHFFSEMDRIRFRRVRFQTQRSVSFLVLTELGKRTQRAPLSPFIICVPKQTHRVLRRTHQVCHRTQWNLSSTALSKQYSTRFLSSEVHSSPPVEISVPLENTKSPHPESPGKLLENYNLAHPGLSWKVPKILKKNTEKVLKV